ncbi:MAG: TIGR02996 domain-containing protein [Gemmataceae bacterium]
MSDEAAFLSGIRAEPQDDLRRLVYADWLDERGDDESRAKAEYLRLEIHISGLTDDHPERDGHVLSLRKLAERLPSRWKAAVSKLPIENCPGQRQSPCPTWWHQLDETRSPEVRFCPSCRKDVFFCDSMDKARRLAETHGHCVVIDLGVRRIPAGMELFRGSPKSDTLSPGVTLPRGVHNPGSPLVATPSPPPGFLRRVWRKLTGK